MKIEYIDVKLMCSSKPPSMFNKQELDLKQIVMPLKFCCNKLKEAYDEDLLSLYDDEDSERVDYYKDEENKTHDLYDELGLFIVRTERGWEEDEYYYHPINYCPFCGKKVKYTKIDSIMVLRVTEEKKKRSYQTYYVKEYEYFITREKKNSAV